MANILHPKRRYDEGNTVVTYQQTVIGQVVGIERYLFDRLVKDANNYLSSCYKGKERRNEL